VAVKRAKYIAPEAAGHVDMPIVEVVPKFVLVPAVTVIVLVLVVYCTVVQTP
jgi:hypothetical protein